MLFIDRPDGKRRRPFHGLGERAWLEYIDIAHFSLT